MPALSQGLEFINYTGTASVAVVYPNSGTGTLIYHSFKVKGDGYYGSSDGLHTIQYSATQNFIGTMTMQASLATEPTETDWFNIANTEKIYTELDDRNTSTVDCFNFLGNFIWVRGSLSIDQGEMLSMLYNH